MLCLGRAGLTDVFGDVDANLKRRGTEGQVYIVNILLFLTRFLAKGYPGDYNLIILSAEMIFLCLVGGNPQRLHLIEPVDSSL
jgi:hypothetical protein